MWTKQSALEALIKQSKRTGPICALATEHEIATFMQSNG